MVDFDTQETDHLIATGVVAETANALSVVRRHGGSALGAAAAPSVGTKRLLKEVEEKVGAIRSRANVLCLHDLVVVIPKKRFARFLSELAQSEIVCLELAQDVYGDPVRPVLQQHLRGCCELLDKIDEFACFAVTVPETVVEEKVKVRDVEGGGRGRDGFGGKGNDGLPRQGEGSSSSNSSSCGAKGDGKGSKSVGRIRRLSLKVKRRAFEKAVEKGLGLITPTTLAERAQAERRAIMLSNCNADAAVKKSAGGGGAARRTLAEALESDSSSDDGRRRAVVARGPTTTTTSTSAFLGPPGGGGPPPQKSAQRQRTEPPGGEQSCVTLNPQTLAIVNALKTTTSSAASNDAGSRVVGGREDRMLFSGAHNRFLFGEDEEQQVQTTGGKRALNMIEEVDPKNGTGDCSDNSSVTSYVSSEDEEEQRVAARRAAKDRRRERDGSPNSQSIGSGMLPGESRSPSSASSLSRSRPLSSAVDEMRGAAQPSPPASNIFSLATSTSAAMSATNPNMGAKAPPAAAFKAPPPKMGNSTTADDIFSGAFSRGRGTTGLAPPHPAKGGPVHPAKGGPVHPAKGGGPVHPAKGSPAKQGGGGAHPAKGAVVSSTVISGRSPGSSPTDEDIVVPHAENLEVVAFRLSNLITGLRVMKAIENRHGQKTAFWDSEVAGKEQADDVAATAVSSVLKKDRGMQPDGTAPLDGSQNQLVNKALVKERGVTICQGPPGTGKTRAVTWLLLGLVKLNERVLACGPTNRSVEELATK